MRNRLDSARAFPITKAASPLSVMCNLLQGWNSGASRMPGSACNSSNRLPWSSQTFSRLWGTWCSVVPQQRTGPRSIHWLHPLYDARVPVFPLLGNHDYGIVRHAALKHFFTRFPHLERCHWFSRTYGPLGLIFLDSNMRRLPVAQWRKQVRWYEQELQRFEQREDIRGVLVLLHHPPYTNSTLVSDDLAVQRVFVPPFYAGPQNPGDGFWTCA